MYNLFFLLICVILAILFGKMINMELPNLPHPLVRTEGYIEGGNFTYFYVHYKGPVILNLTSLSGDADLYISDNYQYPTYDPEIYALHSATCGEDIIEIPESFESPIAVAVYGHADSSNFLLEIYENPAYPYKQWVTLDREIEIFKNTKVEENKIVEAPTDDNKKTSNTQTSKKKKKNKSGSNIPGVFSVLEILQLIFL